MAPSRPSSVRPEVCGGCSEVGRGAGDGRFGFIREDLRELLREQNSSPPMSNIFILSERKGSSTARFFGARLAGARDGWVEVIFQSR